jgi:hypothetical protein
MRWKKVKRSQSIEKDMNSSTASQALQSKENTTSLNLYRSITQLPLSRFIDVVVDGNLYALVISGKPTEQDLTEAWDEIRMQYAEAMKDGEYRLLTSIINEYHRISITYEQVLKFIEILKDRYVPQFAKRLNRYLSTSYKFDVRFPDDYDNDLKRARNNTAGIMLDLKMKQAAYDQAVKKQSAATGDKATREYFISILTTLGNHVGFRITSDISTYEFCDRISRLNKEMEALKTNRKWEKKT